MTHYDHGSLAVYYAPRERTGWFAGSKNALSYLASARFPTNGRSVPVPRFYFHTETDVRVTDADGQEFDSYEEARREAIQTCGQMMKEAAVAFWGSRPWNVSVTDETGLILWEIYIDGQTSAAGRSLEPRGGGTDSDRPTVI